eukprot:GHVU01095261.1.p1 GENE.GHVU01095261.1~~GHVU01095261.1.p1  ORF type:complete len:374 (+),score=46.51 GHVU01095261.1:101-1123(+)
MVEPKDFKVSAPPQINSNNVNDTLQNPTLLKTQAAVTTNMTSDLLSLNTSPDVLSPPSAGNMGLLVDVLGDLGGESTTDPVRNTTNSFPPAPQGMSGFDAVVATAEDGYMKFICRSNGVLFENDLIQVGVKAEYRQNLGRVILFFGNKTQFQFNVFSSEVISPHPDELNIQSKLIEPVIQAGEQKQQIVNIECVGDFEELPMIHVSFTYSGAQQRLSFKLPCFANKFVEPTEMDSATFFQRWKQLSLSQQETQKIFKAQHPIVGEQVRQKLLGFGTGMLDNIDPNPDNYVSAGILHTRNQQVGCLMRLEPNKQAQMYRLTFRCSKDSVSQVLCNLLEAQL